MTALSFSRQYLFAAQGPLLKIHHCHDGSLVATYEAFSSQAIHGIVVSGSVVIVWGGCFISIFQFLPTQDKDLLRLLSTLRAQDWILDISVCPSTATDAPQSAAVLTAHNALLLLDFDPSFNIDPTLTDLTATSRCILYSANLRWISPEHVLIASGTVFGEIILWSCHLAHKKPPRSILHQLLRGHDGSIFGVRILEADSLNSLDHKPSLLASCSDDRTVRLWDIAELPETDLDPQAVADLRSARETGYGVNIADALPDEAKAGHCIARAWGHVSRIWSVRFLPSVGDQCTYLVSFGEDATTQFWRYSPTSPGHSIGDGSIKELTHLATIHAHSGKNIWSSAVTASGEEGIVVATGGADGSVILSSHKLPIAATSDSIESWDIEAISSTAPKEVASKPDKLRGFAFINEKSLVISTNSGNIFLLDSRASHNSEAACTFVSQEASLRGYSVVTTLPALSLSFFAGMDGSVFMTEGESPAKLSLLTKCSGKTTSLFARELLLPGCSSPGVFLLVANIESKTSTLLLLTPSSTTGATGYDNTAQWVVELPAHFTVTSFLPIPHSPGTCVEFVLGSRTGAIALFSLDVSEGVKHRPSITHRTMFERVHGRDAVTDLAWVGNETSPGVDGHIFSVGRDGTFATLQMSLPSAMTELVLANRTSLPTGMVVEGLRANEQDGSLICWGFRSKQFVVIDMTQEKEIITVDCGGANRLWKFEASETGGRFAWIKASQLCLSAPKKAASVSIDAGGHGREIKAVAVRPELSNDALPHMKLFAIGSEDTNIKICAYDTSSHDERTIRTVRTLRKHNTGIQNLQWSSDGQFLFSSGGFEEFFIWKIQPTPLIDVGVVCESVCPAEDEMPDLRIMSFSARQVSRQVGKTGVSEFVISMVRSDSTLRVYLYRSDSVKGQWQILSTGNYLTSCLTQCLDESYIDGRTLMTAGTDGYVAFWPIKSDTAGHRVVNQGDDPRLLRWTSRHQIHQNAIHSMSLHWLIPNKECILVTAGDDSAFAITRFTWGEEAKQTPTVRILDMLQPRSTFQ